MNATTRRFAAAATLTLVLAATVPAAAAPSRDGGIGRDRSSITIALKKIAQRFLGLISLAEPTIPIP